MKYILSVALLLISMNAVAMDACYESLTRYFEDETVAQSWGFLALQTITQQDAEVMIESALWDMNSEAHLESAKQLVKQDGFLFYNLLWSAPSNEGNSVIIVDEKSCEIVVDVGIWSQE